jgi:hypothetical protein
MAKRNVASQGKMPTKGRQRLTSGEIDKGVKYF